MLDEVVALAKDEEAPRSFLGYQFKDQPEADHKPPTPEDIGFARVGDRRRFKLPEANKHMLAIQGQVPMDITIQEPLQDGSYRIVLSPNKSWVVQSMMMSGLDSSTEIELILAPKI